MKFFVDKVFKVSDRIVLILYSIYSWFFIINIYVHACAYSISGC